MQQPEEETRHTFPTSRITRITEVTANETFSSKCHSPLVIKYRQSSSQVRMTFKKIVIYDFDGKCKNVKDPRSFDFQLISIPRSMTKLNAEQSMVNLLGNFDFHDCGKKSILISNSF